MKTVSLWTYYTLAVLVDRLTAGIPASPKVLEAWLNATKASAAAAADQTAMIDRISEEERHGVVFYRDVQGRPCFESRGMKAAFKEAANILKASTLLDQKNFRSKVAERIFVGPPLIPLVDGAGHPSVIQRAERPLTVMTMQGPRTSLKGYEYAEAVDLRFLIKVLNDGLVTEEHLVTMVEYLQDGGLGSDRSQGSGTFQVIQFSPLAEGEVPASFKRSFKPS